MLKKIYPLIQNIIQIVKSNLFFQYCQTENNGNTFSKITISLLREITSKNNANFYYLNCLYSFRTRNKLESYKKVCENKDFCNLAMPSEDTKILRFN